MTYLSLFCCQKQRRSLWTVFKRRGIRYFFLAVVDVEANYLMHRAFHYTTLTSVQVSNGMYEVMSLRIFQAEKKVLLVLLSLWSSKLQRLRKPCWLVGWFWLLPVAAGGKPTSISAQYLWAWNYKLFPLWYCSSVFQLLDCFSIPTVLILSCTVLRARYRLTHIGGMALGLMSVVALVWTDVQDGRGGVSAGGKCYTPPQPTLNWKSIQKLIYEIVWKLF